MFDGILDLPRGAQWMVRIAYTPSLRVQTAPFGKMLVYNHKGEAKHLFGFFCKYLSSWLMLAEPNYE